MNKQDLQELIKKKIKEMSSSGDAGSYNTPFAFKRNVKQIPIGKKKLKEEEITFNDPKLVERIKQFDTARTVVVVATASDNDVVGGEKGV